MNKKLLIGVAVAVVVLGAAGYIRMQLHAPRGEHVAPPSGWRMVQAKTFSVSVPPSWQFTELQGIDSYVGELTGDGATLYFDYGWYSGDIVEDTDPNHTVSYETIGGHRAKLVVATAPGRGWTGVHFPDLGGDNGMKDMLTVVGETLTTDQQETALKIFRSIKFTK